MIDIFSLKQTSLTKLIDMQEHSFFAPIIALFALFSRILHQRRKKSCLLFQTVPVFAKNAIFDETPKTRRKPEPSALLTKTLTAYFSQKAQHMVVIPFGTTIFF